MFLNERQSLVHRTYRLWGDLFLNGVPVRGGGGGNVSNTEDLFGALDDSAYTRNAVGLIAANTSVATLKQTYPTLSDILSAMLNIGSDTLVASGYKYSYVITNPTEFEIAQSQSFSLQIDVDRGLWTPTQTSGSSIPYGLPSSIAGFSLNGTSYSWTLDGANANERVVRYTSANEVSYTFSTLTTVTVQNGTVTLAAGLPGFNTTGTASTTSQLTLSSPSNSLSFRSFAYVYVGTNDNGTTVNPSGDQRVYSTTGSITINNQPQNSNVYVLKQPTALQVLDTLFNDYVTQVEGQFWTKQSFTRTTAPTVAYWRVSFVNNTVSTTQTIRILF